MLSASKASADEDDLLDQVIAEFLRAEATGREGDLAVWLKKYPDCANGLAEFFADRRQVDRLMMPVRMEWSSSIKTASVNCSLDGRQGSVVKVETIEFVPPAGPFDSSRYRPLRFHARGGMGEIWLAEDTRVGRQVAIKRLRSGRKDRAARFLVEAQVTGQLEHPSVVPLHDMGVDEKGNPFYVMKFIHGRRLSDEIADFHARSCAVDWMHDLQFRQLLSTFTDVCNAVAFAHSKGVLHRDIKPENVMLGAYGETLVVDWGLAKVIGQPDQPTSQTSVRLSGGASTATQDGAIVGSPLYMSPEGAAGLVDEIDQSSDVYLLGATLYEILTGKPPRQGSSQSELIHLARESRPLEPRKLDRGIPRALEAICLKATAFRKQDRYTTPLALADDIQRFLADEPTVAYRDPWYVRFGRWARRHRSGLLRSAAAICLVVLAVLAANGYHQASKLAERERGREQFQKFRQYADEAQYFAANTQATFERAPFYDLKRAEQAGKAALQLAGQWGGDAELFPLTEQRGELLRLKRALQLRMAQIQLADTPDHGDPRETLVLLDQSNGSDLATHAYFELRQKCLARIGEPGHAVDPAAAAAENLPWSAEDHFLHGELLRSSDSGSAADWLTGQNVRDREYLSEAIGEFRAALQLDPRHYWARFQLGRCLLAIDRQEEAIEALSGCVALRPTGPWAYSSRGLAMARAGRHSEAMVDLDRALQLDPAFMPGRLNRGFAHFLQGNDIAALADFDSVLAAPDSLRLNEALVYRAMLLVRQQRDEEALADLALAAQAIPGARHVLWLQAQSLFRVGQYTSGQATVARFVEIGAAESKNEKLAQQYFAIGKLLRKLALQLAGESRQEALTRALNQLQLALAAGENTPEAFQQIGAVREMLSQPTEALEAYSNGLVQFSTNATLRNLRGWAHVNAGHFVAARSDFAAAIAEESQNAESHAGMGFVLAKSNERDKARQEAAAALLLGADNYLVLHNVACIYGSLSADPEQQQECESLAIATLQHAIAQWRKLPGGPDEITLIRDEIAFPKALRLRPEFQDLLQ